MIYGFDLVNLSICLFFCMHNNVLSVTSLRCEAFTSKLAHISLMTRKCVACLCFLYWKSKILLFGEFGAPGWWGIKQFPLLESFSYFKILQMTEQNHGKKSNGDEAISSQVRVFIRSFKLPTVSQQSNTYQKLFSCDLWWVHRLLYGMFSHKMFSALEMCLCTY